MFTFLGIAFIFLIVWAVFVHPRDNLLCLLIFSSVFQGGAIANFSIGTSYVGILPYYVVALLICAQLTLYALQDNHILTRREPIKFLNSLFLFTAWAVASAFILPRLFQGAQVYTPRGGIDSQVNAQNALKYTFSNLGQAIYLTINFMVVAWVAVRPWQWASMEKMLNALHAASVAVILVSLYQLVAFWFGLPSIDWLFDNNLGGAQLTNLTLAGVGRISSTFSESSTMAAYLTSYVIFLFIIMRHRQLGIGGFILLVAGVICLLLSTSSTAYIVLAILALIFFVRLLVTIMIKAKLRNISLIESITAAASIGILIIVLYIALQTSYADAIYESTIGKTDSSSYEARNSSNWHAFRIFAETWGLGVGLGSNRPSSFLAWLLSNVGAIGLILLFFAYIRLMQGTKRYATMFRHQDRKTAILSALWWGFLTHVIAKLISQPDIAFPTFWVWTILIVAWLKSAYCEASYLAKVQAPRLSSPTHSWRTSS